MVTFNYEKTPPNNHENLEEEIRKMYKDIFDKYPNKETTFTWNGNKWIISSGIEMALFTFHISDSENTNTADQ